MDGDSRTVDGREIGPIMERLRSEPADLLRFRLKMANAAIKFVIGEGADQAVIDQYRQEAARINQVLLEKIREQEPDKPEAQAVALKTAKLTAKINPRDTGLEVRHGSG